MMRTLSETLDVPLRDRNVLLEAAGYAAIYHETPLDARSMDHVRATLGQILEASEPNPTVVVNRRYDILMANQAAERLIAFFCARPGESLRVRNMARLVVSPHGFQQFIENWEDVAAQVVDRLRSELVGSGGHSEEDEALLAEVAAVGPLRRASVASTPSPALLIPIKIGRGDITMSLFTTITTLGTPLDITLEELRIETTYPADASSKTALIRVTTSPGGETVSQPRQ